MADGLKKTQIEGGASLLKQVVPTSNVSLSVSWSELRLSQEDAAERTLLSKLSSNGFPAQDRVLVKYKRNVSGHRLIKKIPYPDIRHD